MTSPDSTQSPETVNKFIIKKSRPGLNPVYVKQSYFETGIGSLECERLWESTPNEEGAFAHLARDQAGNLFFSLTDMENFDGSYSSVAIDDVDDLYRLLNIVSDQYEDERGPE